MARKPTRRSMQGEETRSNFLYPGCIVGNTYRNRPYYGRSMAQIMDMLVSILLNKILIQLKNVRFEPCVYRVCFQVPCTRRQDSLITAY